MASLAINLIMSTSQFGELLQVDQNMMRSGNHNFHDDSDVIHSKIILMGAILRFNQNDLFQLSPKYDIHKKPKCPISY